MPINDAMTITIFDVLFAPCLFIACLLSRWFWLNVPELV